MIVTVTHRHACPDCGHAWECDSPVGTPCANQAANGNPTRLCDLCWGMAKPARIAAHQQTTGETA